LKHAIASIRAREILDSRGNPTIEVEVATEGGHLGRAAVPSGASKGEFEAIELRDGERRYRGLGVLRAIDSVRTVIAPKFIGVDVRGQRDIDGIMIELDGTDNKSRLGGNATIGVSLACAKAAAASEGLELYEHVGGRGANLMPIPFLNVVNGGKHASNQLDFQEFMVAPTGASSFGEALRIGSEVYHELRQQLLAKYGKGSINVGDEGGFSPPMSRPEEALDAILHAIDELGYGEVAEMAMDVAATTLHRGDEYVIAGERLGTEALIDYYRDIVGSYPIVSIEDPIAEDDFVGFAEATEALQIQVLGDDIFVTNTARLRMGIEMGAANAMLWKVNQVGTLTEALEAAELARRNGYAVQASHRSGDTEDTFVSDLAVGIGCGQIKAGAPCRGERTAKYNRLLRIEEDLGNRSRYPKGLHK